MGECPLQPADRLVGLQRERLPTALIEELRQGVLKEGERSRVMGHIGHQFGHQRRLDDDSLTGGGPHHRFLQFRRGQRQNVHRFGRQQ